jgi:hypothetical protein
MAILTKTSVEDILKMALVIGIKSLEDILIPEKPSKEKAN